ncbi:hypothetical protein PIB30_012632 [Stylosanthes scabra]|uniref:Uncharacterized protein n=1 Tax=Stylosanthes scabra TaxID=79078 RepID=A0ABU6Y4S6_9FABA|nr:hypothetical protein [Stylosanthes scabra]
MEVLSMFQRPKSVALEYEKPGTYGTGLIYPLDRLVETLTTLNFVFVSLPNLLPPTNLRNFVLLTALTVAAHRDVAVARRFFISHDRTSCTKSPLLHLSSLFTVLTSLHHGSVAS